tara:strand:+ start:1164 stop:3194 length:2031 start_codon:yes stop_codon:yes gene_type:complete
MANIKKAFNFRNGVQVDDDNLIVNANGLVGVGTTVPTEALDVRGKVKVIQDPNVAGSGVVNATTGIITSLTVTDTLIVNSSNISSGQVGEGVAIGSPSGIITATASGIVTYFGDGSNLDGLPTSQWDNVDVGLGYTSIYARGNVGVGTVDPRFTLQVGGNNGLTLVDGVGINSTGGIVATGVVTATTFKGNVDGDISSGLSTIIQLENTNTNTVGVVTAGSGFVGDLTGNVTSGNSDLGVAIASSLDVSGSVTGIAFTGPLSGNVNGNVTGDLTGDVTSGLSSITRLETTYINSSTTTGVVTTGRVVATSANLGISTASTFNVSGKLGVGINAPEHNVEVYSAGISSVTVIGQRNSVLSLCQRIPPTTGVGDSMGGIRFGNEAKSFDIFNGDTGNINQYLHLGAFVGVNTGNYNWYHRSTTNLMTLTYDGKLGIGKSQPDSKLDVVGVSSFTGNVSVIGDLEVTGAFTGTASIPDIINGSNINTISGISTFNKLNVAGSVGLSTLAIGVALADTKADIDARGSTALISRVAIGSSIENIGDSNVLVGGPANFASGIGINTSLTGITSIRVADTPIDIGASNITLDRSNLILENTSGIILKGEGNVGSGISNPRAAVDFGDAGNILGRYVILPRVTTTERGNLTNITSTGVEAGALIFNTSTNKFQGYTGSTWVDLH